MKRKATLTVMTILALLMALSLSVLIPSGALTEEARVRYESLGEEGENAGDEDEDYDESARIQPIAVIANAALSDILPAALIDPLDLDITMPGSTPIDANFTDYSYRDDSIIVELEKKHEFDSDIYIAYVRIATPSQIRTAIAGTKLSSSRANLITTLCDNYNGIVAMNGDYYSDPDAGRTGGVIVRQGQTYREKVSNSYDMLVIDELGDFHILPHGKESQQNQLDAIKSNHTIINSFYFGPGLVIDGIQQEGLADYVAFGPYAKNPRAGIAQIDVLTYAMVVVNGRDPGVSEGVTMDEFATIMHDIGAKQAYNLDGGNSATLAFRGEVFNVKPNKERAVGDIIYFASAIGQE